MFGRTTGRDSEKTGQFLKKGTSGRPNVWTSYIRYLKLTTKSNYDLVVGTALPSYVGGHRYKQKITNLYQGLKIVTGITLI